MKLVDENSAKVVIKSVRTDTEKRNAVTSYCFMNFLNCNDAEKIKKSYDILMGLPKKDDEPVEITDIPVGIFRNVFYNFEGFGNTADGQKHIYADDFFSYMDMYNMIETISGKGQGIDMQKLRKKYCVQTAKKAYGKN